MGIRFRTPSQERDFVFVPSLVVFAFKAALGIVRFINIFYGILTAFRPYCHSRNILTQFTLAKAIRCTGMIGYNRRRRFLQLTHDIVTRCVTFCIISSFHCIDQKRMAIHIYIHARLSIQLCYHFIQKGITHINKILREDTCIVDDGADISDRLL